MTNQDWLITDDGRCEAREIIEQDELSENPYRLFRFLTDLEDILRNISDDTERLEKIRPIVRRLLNSSEWLHRSEEHTSELQSQFRISYAVFCLKKKNTVTLPLDFISTLFFI